MIEFIDGFDCYESIDITKKWSSVAGWTPTAGICRPGVGQVSALGQGQGLNLTSVDSITKTISNLDTVIVGFYFYVDALAHVANSLITFLDASAEQCSIRITAAGLLTHNRGSTVLATSANSLLLKTWHHLEAKVKVNNGAGTYEVRINGTSGSWLSGSGVDNAVSANNYSNGVTIASPLGTDYFTKFDDFYILNPTSPVNDFIGPQKIFALKPSSPGTYAQWTPNWLDNFANVNESLFDGDASFNYSATGGQVDSFNFQNAVSGSVTGLQMVIAAKQDAGGQRVLTPYMIFGGSAVSGSPTFNTSAASYQFHTKIMERDPSGNPWTAGNINTTEFGYKLVS